MPTAVPSLGLCRLSYCLLHGCDFMYFISRGLHSRQQQQLATLVLHFVC